MTPKPSAREPKHSTPRPGLVTPATATRSSTAPPRAPEVRRNRRGGRNRRDFEERRAAAIANEKARARIHALALRNGIEVPPLIGPAATEPTPTPRTTKVKPRYFVNCSYPPCPAEVGTMSARPGLVYCGDHRDPRAREKYEREVDVMKKMQSAGITGTRMVSTSSRRKRHRERYDASEADYL